MAELPQVARPIGIYQDLVAKTTETLILTEKILSLSRDSFNVTNVHGTPFMTIKCRYMSASGQETLVMTGNWGTTSADIQCERTGATVARISRALELLVNRQSYTLVVAPGVDMALMVALCVALDEKKKEKQRRQ
ncbi:hypothetical protein E4U42_001819 [Claviceps africana]|uniref:Uncharacterized protein n=1 Tax=Claviceps africana TaxID=83212 RepID=A0A8K0J9H1_9HYPO|nr:hypothetical protein E4U42_001819 [Claviceps africana]